MIEDERISRRLFLGYVAGVAAGNSSVFRLAEAVANLTSTDRPTSLILPPKSEEAALGIRRLGPLRKLMERRYREIIEASWSVPQFNPDRNITLDVSDDASTVFQYRDVWPTRLWWPIFEKPALKQGLPRIADEYWPAYVFDLEFRRIMGRPSNIWKQAIEKSNIIQRDRPDTRDSAGYCPWVAAAQLTERQPQYFADEVLGGETDPERIIMLKEGLLAIKHAGDILVPIPVTREALIVALGFELPTIVDLPANRGGGNWFRPLLGISPDGSRGRVTNFGPQNVDLPASAIRSAYIVHSNQSTESFAPGIREATAFWRYKNVDRGLIDRIVYGG